MSTYQTKDVARILGMAKSTSTIRSWAKQYNQYLSPSAQKDPGNRRQRRVFTDHDLHIFWTIRLESQAGTSHDDIAAMISTGELSETLPPDMPAPEETPIDLIPYTTAQIQISTLQDQITGLQKRITGLETQLTEERTRSNEHAEHAISVERELGDTKAELAAKQSTIDILTAESKQNRVSREDERKMYSRFYMALGGLLIIAVIAIMILAALVGAG